MGRTSTFSRLLVLGLAFALTAHALVSYPRPLLREIAASTILLAMAVAAGRWMLRRQPGPRPLSFVFRPSSFPITVFLLVFSSAVTVQALVAREVYGPLRAIDSTPGYAVLARFLHYLVVVAIVLAGRERSHAVGLGAAMVYTSVFYCPTFATPEAAPPFIPLAALALVLLTATPFTQYAIRNTFRPFDRLRAGFFGSAQGKVSRPLSFSSFLPWLPRCFHTPSTTASFFCTSCLPWSYSRLQSLYPSAHLPIGNVWLCWSLS